MGKTAAPAQGAPAMTHAETALQTTEKLIRERIPELLGDKFTISRIEASAFRRNNHDVNYMTVFFKPGHPPLDTEEFDEFTIDGLEGVGKPGHGGHSCRRVRWRRNRPVTSAAGNAPFPTPTPLDPPTLLVAAERSINNPPVGQAADRETIHRAVSTAYYSVFHAINASNADTLAAVPSNRQNPRRVDRHLTARCDMAERQGICNAISIT